jgi:acyl carrier protein
VEILVKGLPMSQDSRSLGPQFRANRKTEQEAVRTTIVGGRPPGSGQSHGIIPRGMEVLIKKAAVDPAFKIALLERRAAAADDIGLSLEPAEAMMLAAASHEQIEAIVARTDVPQEHRRAFLGQAAAAMLAAVMAMAGGQVEGGGFAKEMSGSGGMIMGKPYKKHSGTVENRIIAVLAEHFKVDKKTITKKTSLAGDLHATDKDLEKIRSNLNQEFDIAFSQKPLDTLDTVEQMVQRVTLMLKSKSNSKTPTTRGISPK